MKIGFEFNELYRHCEDRVGRKHHKDKTKFFAKHGVMVVQVFEDKCDYRRKTVKSKARHLLGLNVKREKVHARECVVEVIEPQEKNEFFGRVPRTVAK